jgi:hypothetical protein
MSTRLSWDPNDGFVLDLEHVDGDLTVRVVGAPVPADGLARLRSSPVALHELEVLFRSQVDWADAPAQLQQLAVHLVGAALAVEGKLEDPETGAETSFQATLPILVPEAPEAGGPVAPPPDEDELAEEDDEDWSVEGVIPPRSGGGGGFDGLLKALLAKGGAGDEDAPGDDDDLDDDPDDDDAPEDLPEQDALEDEEEPEDGGVLDRLLGLAHHDTDDIDLTHAHNFLRMLVNDDQLALSDPGALDALIPGAARILLADRSAESRARALSEWLMAQPGVDELFLTDEDLEALLEQW